MRKKDRDGLYKQAGSANWYGSYTDASGRRCRRSTGTPNRQEAEAILSQWRLQAHQQRTWGTEPPHSLHELMLSYVDAHQQKRSLERDSYSIQHLCRLLGEEKDVGTLTTGDIYGYQQRRTIEGVVAGTINREVGFLSAALNWAVRSMGWKVGNPAAGHHCQEPPSRERWLTQEEASQLLETARQERQAPHLADFITLALHTGMRSGELLGLEWRRVDIQQGRILLESIHQKSGKPGVVPLNQTARESIIARARFRAMHCPASPWVFCDRKGRRIASIKKGFASAVQRTGIAHCTPHDLRRTFGSWLVQSGVPIQQVARLLRHSDIRVTDRVYAHLQPEQLQSAVAVLDRHSTGHSLEKLNGRSRV
jgi:integrase